MSCAAGCAGGDPRATPFEPIRLDWCAPGEAPTLSADGWPDCSTLTRRDAEAVTAHNETGERLFGWQATATQ